MRRNEILNMTTNNAVLVDHNGAAHKPSSNGLINPAAMVNVGKKEAARLLDDRTFDEFPT